MIGYQEFRCERCDIVYRTKRSLTPVERGGRFDCISCNAEIHEWSGSHDYAEWQAINWFGWLERAVRRSQRL